MKNLLNCLSQRSWPKKTLTLSALSLAFLFLQWSVMAATDPESRGDAEAVVRPPIERRRMGVEVETSSIKINNPGADKVKFTISNPPGCPRIILEEDTLDRTFSRTAGLEEFSQNVECKTVGAFEGADLLVAVRYIQLLLENLYISGAAVPFTVTPDWLQGLLGAGFTITAPALHRPFIVRTKITEPPEEVATSREAHASGLTDALRETTGREPPRTTPPSAAAGAPREVDASKVADVPGAADAPHAAYNSIVRPQLTYQLPLEEMQRLFIRLQELGHRPIDDFLKAVDPTIALPEVTIEAIREKRTFLSSMFAETMRRQLEIRKFFKERVGVIFHPLPAGKIRGFCLLFFYYWYELFNNKQAINPNEPGIKQFLGIMSRLPFSQLHDSLNGEERAELNTILTPLVEGYGQQYRLRAYEDYDNNEVRADLTVQAWYYSIIDDAHRKEVRGRRVDILSPPPSLDPSFESMGALDIEVNACVGSERSETFGGGSRFLLSAVTSPFSNEKKALRIGMLKP